MGKWSERIKQFTEKELQMALHHMKRHSGSLLIREMWIKTIRFHFHWSDRQQPEEEWGNGQAPRSIPGGRMSALPRRTLGQEHWSWKWTHTLRPAELILQIYSHTRVPWCMFKVTHWGKARHNKIFSSRRLAPWIMAHPNHRIYAA